MNTYKLELDDNDLRELSLALQERPYKSVAAVIAKIGEQVQKQLDSPRTEPDGNAQAHLCTI